jgi:signal transduction histidine kinase
MTSTIDSVEETNLAVAEVIEPTPAKRRGLLLIVDDEDGPRQSLRVIFKDEYDLLMAEDGPTAIELAKKHPIDVAVLDIRMAGMSGIEVLERLKFVNPEIEAIMTTAFETTDTMRQALRLRACDYINKPFDIGTIRTAVAQAMQRRVLEGEIHSSAEKVQELLAELQNQRIEEQIAKTRGDIYASIIHDINGPLTVISGFVQVLTQRLNRTKHMELDDLEFIKDRLRIISRQVGNCIEISRRYLGFLRRQSSEHAPRVSVNQLFKDLEQLMRVHPSVQDNEFCITPLKEDISVKINGTDLIQILLNLAVNAFQCVPQKHRVEIGGEILRTPLDLSKFKDGPHDRLLNVESADTTPPLVKFWVRDNGPGIPPEVLPKIFQTFFTTKSARQGTGLGLSIVQRLIKEGKGALHVHTQLNEGTTFAIYLPAGGQLNLV